jgi:cyclohexa-1,5-dienecarbonyl-CoA hydratase
MDTTGHVRCTVEGGVATLTMDRPPLNILTRDVLASLRGVLEGLATDTTLRVLVLGAAGKHFSAGADVGEHLPPAWQVMIPEFLATIAQLRAFPAPVIAAVRGRCLGGGLELALGADMIVAGEGASFGQPEIVLGVTPPAACALLPGIVGPARAAELIYTGDPMSAADALAAGLVARVVPDGSVDEEARVLAGRIARHSAPVLRIAKASLRTPARRHAETEALAEAGRRYADDLMTTHDATLGLTAFLGKHTPTWTHA